MKKSLSGAVHLHHSPRGLASSPQPPGPGQAPDAFALLMRVVAERVVRSEDWPALKTRAFVYCEGRD